MILEVKFGIGKLSLITKLIFQVEENILVLNDILNYNKIKEIFYLCVIKYDDLYKNENLECDKLNYLKKLFKTYFDKENCKICIINLNNNKYLKEINVTKKINIKKQMIKEIKNYVEKKFEEYETRFEKKIDKKFEEHEKKFNKKFEEFKQFLINNLKNLK